MALPSSGPLALTDIQTEFGGSNPASLSEYYAGGGYVPSGTSGTNGAVPSSGTLSFWNFYGTQAALPPSQRAIFGFGYSNQTVPHSLYSITNLVSNTGVVASDTVGVGTARTQVAAAGYGGDKAIFGYGNTLSEAISATNQVSNTGVVASDTTGVGTARRAVAAAGYGGDKALFGFGVVLSPTSLLSVTNLVSNTGVVSSDTATGASTRSSLAAAGYGGDKAIFGYGNIYAQPSSSTITNTTNLVSNAGVVASDTAGVGTVRTYISAAGYGGDKALFGFGLGIPAPYQFVYYATTNLVSNTGVVASDTAGVGTPRRSAGASKYGGDKAIFLFGYVNNTITSISSLVSNTGVVASDTAGVGTPRYDGAAAGYSFS